MIIKALRVAELGPFDDGIALEGLSGGLDVLVGSNEAGKTSLFRALLTLVEERHTATGARIDVLRSAGGGAPLIEADIEVHGRLMRVRKRYIAQRQATVQDLATGQITRGPDAEAHLDRLFSPPGLGSAPRRLLWVAQAESFRTPAPTAETAGALSALIEQEAAATTGSGLARRVASAVAAELALLQTTHKPPRPTGALKKAQTDHKLALDALATARANADRQAARRTELERRRTEEAALASPDAVAVLGTALAAAERALNEGTNARKQLAASAERLDATNRLEAAASIELQHFEAQQFELHQLADALATGEATRASHVGAEQAAAAAAADLEKRRADIAADQEQTRAQLRMRQAVDAREALGALDQRIADATAASHEIAALETTLAAEPIRDEDLARLRRLSTEIARAEAEANATAARVEVAYAPDAAARIRIGDRTIDAGETVLARSELVITIPGIGEIRVKPGAGDATRSAAHADTLRGEVNALLQHLAAADIETAEAHHAEAAGRKASLAEARARLRAIAPDGIAASVSERERLAARTDPTNPAIPAELPARSDIESRLARLDDARTAIDTLIAKAQVIHRDANSTLIRWDADLAAKRQRHDALAAGLVDAVPRHACLTAARASARHASAEAQRERDKWQALAPDEINLAAAANEADRARKTIAQRELQLQDVRRRIAELVGELRSDDANGVGIDLVRCEEQAAAAAAELAARDSEVAALRLLVSKLQAAEAVHRSSTLRPLMERFAPLLQALLPDATAELAGLADVATLVRSGRTERYGQLSDGTREQIAVLVRLAWARLLAQARTPSPLVLDDALVFSDDTRLQRMFALLAEAAKIHQVIVLSCHEQATRVAATRAGANLLTLAPWIADEPAAMRARG